MHYYLLNDRRPIKTKAPVQDLQQAQAKARNMIVTKLEAISPLQYLYYAVRYELSV